MTRSDGLKLMEIKMPDKKSGIKLIYLLFQITLRNLQHTQFTLIKFAAGIFYIKVKFFFIQ